MNAKHKVATGILHDTPVPGPEQKEIWGSDAIAAMLGELDIPYLALNPGASYRGLHDSIVNYIGNKNPQMLLCLHEESAVSIAQGYAKALIAQGEALLLAAGCPKISLMVRRSNTQVLGFYQALGYAQDDVVSLGKRLIPDH